MSLEEAIKQAVDIFWKQEQQKCVRSTRYFYDNYFKTKNNNTVVWKKII